VCSVNKTRSYDDDDDDDDVVVVRSEDCFFFMGLIPFYTVSQM